jgi:hypothetical protein
MSERVALPNSAIRSTTSFVIRSIADVCGLGIGRRGDRCSDMDLACRSVGSLGCLLLEPGEPIAFVHHVAMKRWAVLAIVPAAFILSACQGHIDVFALNDCAVPLDVR